jgi:hypothetical protein
MQFSFPSYGYHTCFRYSFIPLLNYLLNYSKFIYKDIFSTYKLTLNNKEMAEYILSNLFFPFRLFFSFIEVYIYNYHSRFVSIFFLDSLFDYLTSLFFVSYLQLN